MADNQMIEAAKTELSKRGVKISIQGCGCCGSPTVKLEIDGNLIIYQIGDKGQEWPVDDIVFDMFKKPE